MICRFVLSLVCFDLILSLAHYRANLPIDVPNPFEHFEFREDDVCRRREILRNPFFLKCRSTASLIYFGPRRVAAQVAR